MGDYPTGAPNGELELVFLDSGLKPINQSKPSVVRIGDPNDEIAESQTVGYETVEEALARDGDRPASDESSFLAEYNRLNLRRKRIRNIREAKLASRMDAQLETVNGLITDSIERISQFDETTKIHSEAQTALTKRLAEEVIKAAPPPPPPDWAGMIERGLGHIAQVVLAAIGAKKEKDADEHIKKLERRVARLQKSLSRGLPEPQKSIESTAALRSVERKPAIVEQKPAVIEQAPAIIESQRTEANVSDDSDEPPSPPAVATSERVAEETTTDTKKPSASRRDKPNTTAWNRIKRVVASLTDGEITMFVAHPQLGLSFLGCLAEMCPGGALAT